MAQSLIWPSGSFNYAKSFGSTSMKSENAKPLDLNTVMWVASCTKLMTSICAMQLVERGQLSLDDPVYKHIPELEPRTVITSIDAEGKPTEQKHTKAMTLRHLLTHSSGLTYDSLHPLNIAWLTYHKRKPSQSGTVLERFSSPLVFEPGESWAYGPSTDYVGLLIERVSGMTLEQFMKENLWNQLGIKDMTFNPSKRPDMKARLADMSLRGEDGKVAFSDARLPYHDENRDYVEGCMGGQGSFVSPEEYLKVLQAVLNADVDEKILKKETLETFFAPQLGGGSKGMLNMVLQDDMVRLVPCVREILRSAD
jgi:CubicO group peptidase (beta-lactamase class C family)